MCFSRSRQQFGTTLIELIVFIVIVSVALIGVLTVLNVTAQSSGDPMIRKQMLAVAESILEEVMLQPFTWCDPDDPTAATATAAIYDPGQTQPDRCWYPVEAIGVETVAGNTDTNPRLGTTFPFDNVSDYNGLSSITTSIIGTPMPAGYSATIAVAQDSLNLIPATESLLITVTVCHAATCPSAGADTIVLNGYRTRHSPNSLP